jgi:hypothetical protein
LTCRVGHGKTVGMRTIPAAVLILLAQTLGACAGEPPALRVGAASFTRQQLADLAPDRRALLADVAAFGTLAARGALDSLARPLAAREAHRSRLSALPYALAAARDPGPDSLRAIYAASPQWELTVRHIVRLVPEWADGSERAAQLAVARETARRARAGEDFAKLAAELSQEPGAAARGGVLEPGRAGSWVEPFWDAALALRPGEVSPVVGTRYGYHVIRLDDRRPIPFDSADHLPLMRRLVSPARARAAMEAWVPTRPPVVLDPAAVLAARRALAGGEAPGDLVIGRSPGGDVFDAVDLALARAALETDERRALDAANDAAFGRWVENEVREAFWADEAERIGVSPRPDVVEDARARWERRLASFAEALGFEEGMPRDAIGPASLRAVDLNGQEALIARAELPGLRPLLRRIYPAIAPSGTSSEIRKSGSSR